MSAIRFAGDSNLDQYVPNAQKFSTLVGQKRGYPFVSTVGKSGHTAASFLTWIQADVIAHLDAGDVCAFMFGTNEMATAYQNDTPNATAIASYIANMGTAIDTLAAAGIVPVVITPPPARIPEIAIRFPAWIEALAALCASKGVELVNIHAYIANLALTGTKAAFNALYFADPDKYHWVAAGHTYVKDCPEWTTKIPAPDLSGLSVILNEPHNGGLGNLNLGTFRVTTPQLCAPGSVTMARLTFKAVANEPMPVHPVFAGVPTTDANASSLVPVRVNGQTTFTVPTGGELVSDAFPWPGGRMIITGRGIGGAAADALSAKTGATGFTTYFKNADEADDLTVTGFIPYAGYLSFVTKIEAGS